MKDPYIVHSMDSVNHRPVASSIHVKKRRGATSDVLIEESATLRLARARLDGCKFTELYS